MTRESLSITARRASTYANTDRRLRAERRRGGGFRDAGGDHQTAAGLHGQSRFDRRGSRTRAATHCWNTISTPSRPRGEASRFRRSLPAAITARSTGSAATKRLPVPMTFARISSSGSIAGSSTGRTARPSSPLAGRSPERVRASCSKSLDTRHQPLSPQKLSLIRSTFSLWVKSGNVRTEYR